MKKILIISLTSLLLIILILPVILAVTPQERENYNKCKEDCRNDKKFSDFTCKSNFFACKNNCIVNSTNNSTDNSTIINTTYNRTCMSQCGKENSNCLKKTASDHNTCQLDCKKIIQPKCIEGNNTYGVGENFTQGCDVCECKRNGKISCKKDAFCNKDPVVDENLCNESGGYYYPLCNGPYFGIFCSSQKFCLCGGNHNYTCPTDHECLKDFISPNQRKTIDNGWKNLIGKKLGDIGVCVNNNNLTSAPAFVL